MKMHFNRTVIIRERDKEHMFKPGVHEVSDELVKHPYMQAMVKDGVASTSGSPIVADNTVADAEKKAAAIIADAEKKAAAIIADAEEEATDIVLKAASGEGKAENKE